jgi:lipoprotein signal peptidase
LGRHYDGRAAEAFFLGWLALIMAGAVGHTLDRILAGVFDATKIGFI